jgi:exonuclease III
MDMRFGTWNIRGLNKAGFLMTVSSELKRSSLDFVGMQESR